MPSLAMLGRITQKYRGVLLLGVAAWVIGISLPVSANTPSCPPGQHKVGNACISDGKSS